MDDKAPPPVSIYDPALAETLRDGDASDEVAVVLRLSEVADLPSHVRQVTRFGNIATVRVQRSWLAELVNCDAVASAEAARKLRSTEAELDAVDEEYIDLAGEPETRRPLGTQGTGRGVVVGCLDWGCDFAFPDFLEPLPQRSDDRDYIDIANARLRHRDGGTRLLALWDQRSAAEDPAHPNRFGYGRIYTREEINAALEQEDPYSALGYRLSNPEGEHGTHVLSIAAGNGRGGGPVGVAPEADLVFVHLSRTTRVLSTGNLGDSATVLEALDAIFEIADGKPCVVNMSVGAHGGPHDGTTHVEMGIDRAVTMQANRAVVNSAGNYRRRNAHAEGRLREGEAQTLRFKVPADDPTDSEIELYYESSDQFTVSVLDPDGQTQATVKPDEEEPLRMDGEVVGYIYHHLRHPTGSSGDRHVDLFLRDGAPGGHWALILTGEKVIDGRYHAWIERDSGLSPAFEGDSVAERTTTGTLCNGLHSITVGAIDPHRSDLTFGSFSSSGPTRDGRMKPEIVAPGVQIAAAQSAPPRQSPGARYVRKGGTSMAAPHVTGAVALMYEAAGTPLDIADLRALLFSSATRPALLADMDTTRLHLLGHGVLDIPGAEAAARSWGREAAARANPTRNSDDGDDTLVDPPPTTDQSRSDTMNESSEPQDLADNALASTLTSLATGNTDVGQLLRAATDLIQKQPQDPSAEPPALCDNVDTRVATYDYAPPPVAATMIQNFWPGSAESSAAESFTAPSALTDWRDLIRFSPPPSVVRAIGSRRPIYYRIQTIGSARSDDVNLDFYPVYVSRMPRLGGRQLDAASLFDYFRRNINDFLDTDEAEFEGASTADTARWASSSPLGTVLYIDIGGWKIPDDAYVVCSDYSPRHWRFSTLTQRVAGMASFTDEHPVSGTREFGYQGSDQRAVFYTKGADRGTFRLEWMNRMAFSGGHQLWVSFQREFVNWVNRHGGRAARFAFGPGPRPDVFISQRKNWRRVNRLV